MNRLVWFRLLDTRRRIDARVWAARAEVIERQLRVLRASAPA